jgi:hypothetical protein
MATDTMEPASPPRTKIQVAAPAPAGDGHSFHATGTPALEGVSGRYVWQGGDATAPPQPRSAALRLDVDGRYPLAAASGEMDWGFQSRVHWVASLAATGPGRWRGTLWYVDGSTQLFPYRTVSVEAVPGSGAPELAVSFGAGEGQALSQRYRFASPYLREVELELDYTEDATPVLQVGTHDHPIHPATLARETLTLQNVFERAGFEVRTPAGSLVPLDAAGAGHRWNDSELNDAMQVYWSRFDARAQWSLWFLFAALHEDGEGLGGIMFDSSGPQQRQGAAVFTESFIRTPPAGDANGAAWVERMRFWTACHEMGHCFNLAHSFQKELGAPWLPLVPKADERSFMNYPFRFPGGPQRFFSEFEYRFSPGELLFMRHAPERFVEMGNAAWFDDHGFEQASSPAGGLVLEVRANRREARFDFLEACVLELKLSNPSDEARLVDAHALGLSHQMTVVVKRDGHPARLFRPMSHRIWKAPRTVLEPGGRMYETLFVGADRDGWLVAEPGCYTVQVALDVGGERVVSNPFRLRVDRPASYEQENLAWDLFSTDVGRVLAYDGSRRLESANDTLREVVDRFPHGRAAVHARVALALPHARDYKLLDAVSARPGGSAGRQIHVVSADPERARRELHGALLTEPDAAAEALAHKDFRYYVDALSRVLEETGERGQAAEAQRQLRDTLARRRVPRRILEQIREREEGYRRDER